MNNTIVVTSETAESGMNQTVLIAVVSSIVGLIVVGGIVGYFLYKKYNDRLPTVEARAVD